MTLAWNSPALSLEACEHYQKGSYRNRCHLAGPNGVQRLSIPLLHGKHQQTPIREVRIAPGTDWPKQHWRSIRTAYGNAPFFEHYADELAPFYEKSWPFLFDFNLELLQFVLGKIGYRGEISCSETFLPRQTARAGDFREMLRPNAPVPAWFSPLPYAQVFTDRHGFLPDLAVLDLLMCCGKGAGAVLERSYNWQSQNNQFNPSQS